MAVTAKRKPRKLHRERISKRAIVEEKEKLASETPLLDPLPPVIPPFDGGPLLLATKDYDVQPVPGIGGAKRATAYLRVSDIPDLSKFLDVNPRSPKPNAPIIRDIKETLTKHPLQMVIKNRGIFILVDKIEQGENLIVTLSDPVRHGLIDGGHTYAAIRQLLETGTEDEKHQAGKAHVALHVFSGVPHDLAVEMAAGLNTSRQVSAVSLENLRGHYDVIKKVLKGVPGGDEVVYAEGDPGHIPVGEVLAYAEIFNQDRYPLSDNPFGLYAHRGRVISEAAEDFEAKSPGLLLSVANLPEILKLADGIRYVIQPLRQAAEPGRRGRGRPRKDASKEPAEKPARILLPFLGVKVQERLPNGWLYPLLAAFRANVTWDSKAGTFKWKKPCDKLLKTAAPELVAICQAEQRAAAGKPEWVGKRESAYRQCKMQIDLTIQKLSDK